MADLLRSCWEDSSGKFGLLRSSTASSSFPIILRGNRVYFFSLCQSRYFEQGRKEKINRQKAGIKKEKCIMAFVMPSSITLVNSLFSSNKVTAFIRKQAKRRSTLFDMFFALSAYTSVFLDSSLCRSAGEMWAIMTVWQLPESGSFSRRVSLESR